MTQLAIFGLGVQGRSPNISAQKRKNLYLEIYQTDKDKTVVSAHNTPGLELFADLGDTPVRGMHSVGDWLYTVHRGNFARINNSAVVESKGTLLTTTGRVGIADNGAQVMVVDGTSGYIYTIATGSFAQISDADFPGANTVTFLDQYFIVNRPNTGQFWISALLDGLSWNALAFATAESNPDKLVRVISERSILYLFGEYSSEMWSSTQSLDFPFARVQGGSTEWGLAARESLVKFDDSLCWLARNRLGQVSVARSTGLEVRRVSTPDLDSVFAGYVSTSDATAYGYMLSGHPMYQINFPSASRTWLYDGKTDAWSELQSIGLTRHRGETQTSFLDNAMISDFENGKIYKMKTDVYTDNGAMIVREIASPHYFGPDYDNFVMSELRLDIESGVGRVSGQGSDPQVMLSLSRDGGHSFGNERWASIGMTGEYRERARWRRLGLARDTVFRLRISDPVKVVMLGASLNVERGTA